RLLHDEPRRLRRDERGARGRRADRDRAVLGLEPAAAADAAPGPQLLPREAPDRVRDRDLHDRRPLRRRRGARRAARGRQLDADDRPAPRRAGPVRRTRDPARAPARGRHDRAGDGRDDGAARPPWRRLVPDHGRGDARRGPGAALVLAGAGGPRRPRRPRLGRPRLVRGRDLDGRRRAPRRARLPPRRRATDRIAVAAFRAVTLAVEESRAERLRKLARIRAGQLLGLLFLIGPFHDLGQASLPAVRLAGVVAALAVFVSLYLALLPPISPIARRGQPATLAGLAALAVSAGLALALGAPGSFAALFIYFVAAAGIVLPVRGAIATIAVTAAAVGGGLAATGSDSSVVWAHVLTILAIGAVMGSLGRHARTISELRAARHELARLAVAEERLRIARDLHDLLGHTLSVIALKSELAAKLVADEPQRAHDELGDVQRVARQALTEVREAVHGYRRLAFSDAVAGARAALSAAGID